MLGQTGDEDQSRRIEAVGMLVRHECNKAALGILLRQGGVRKRRRGKGGDKSEGSRRRIPALFLNFLAWLLIL